MVGCKSSATEFGSIRLEIKLLNASYVCKLMRSSLSLSASPLPFCLALALLAPGLSHMVDWSSRGVEASSVGEVQELRQVAAGAEISLSRPGRTQTPPLSPSTPFSVLPPPSWIGHRVHCVHRLTSPLPHQYVCLDVPRRGWKKTNHTQCFYLFKVNCILDLGKKYIML